MAGDSWPTTRISLLLRVKDPRDDAAWGEFVARYRQPIVQFCARKLAFRSADSEDVAQEVLLKLLAALRQFEYDPTGSFRKWLRTVARYAVLNYADKEARRLDRAVGGDAQLSDWIKASPDNVEELSDVLSATLRRDMLQDSERLVRSRVDAATWQAYELRRKEAPAKEVAAELGMTTAAVHKAYSRVKQLLRQEVAMLLKNPAGN
jgi:RNA polymerase sigma-70 factor (ECF subfamily)